MAVHYRTQGFIIKKNDRGEADQVFTIYTKDYGKLEILGRAIRKIKSKLRGGAELFYLSEIEFIQGKTYKTLTDAVLIDNFSNIRNDFEKLRIIYKISEDLDILIKGQEPDLKIWHLLEEVFFKLNLLEIRNWKLEILYYYFFWNFVSILGYHPEFKNFYLLGEEDKSSPSTLANDRVFEKGKEKISVDIFKILRIILKKDLKTLLKLKLELIHQKSLKDISQRYFDYLLSKVIM